MAKILFVLLLLFHGLIHIMGFLKAFGISGLNQLTQYFSKTYGTLWLIASVLFITASALFIFRNEFWWVTAFAGIILSQILIFAFWKDAKFGSIANLIIFAVALIACSKWNFNRIVSNEIKFLIHNSGYTERAESDTGKISKLPAPVQKWLLKNGIDKKDRILFVRLKQNILMKTKPGQEDWTEAKSEQYFDPVQPSFIWKVDMKMYPLIDIAGRDKFFNGKGEMLIKIFSLYSIVNASGDKIDKGTMQRFLAEIVWFPSEALSPFIQWEIIDELSAKATMSYKGTTASGNFYFNEHGDFIKFSTMRNMENEIDSGEKEWIITVDENKIINGINIPVKINVTWRLESGDWTWLKIELEDLEYNNPSEY